MTTRGPALLLSLIALAACGTSSPQPAVPNNTPTLPSSAPPAVATPPAPTATPSSTANAHQLVNESSRQNPIPLQVLLPDSKPASEFPKAVEQDGTCWKSVELRGDHDKDYDALMAKCGEPTGLLPYTQWVESRLHDVSQGDKKDPRDFYKVRVREGMCYRFIAVGDGSMVALDMHLYKASGALIGTTETKSLALLLQSRTVLCADNTEDWIAELDVDAKGKGRYKFAIWTRPAKSK